MASQFDFLLSQVRAAGSALAGGKVYFYQPGTNTLKAVWLDHSETTPAANPYTLDADATAQIYGKDLYRVVIKDATGITRFDRNNVSSNFYDEGIVVTSGAQTIGGAKTFTEDITAPNISATAATVAAHTVTLIEHGSMLDQQDILLDQHSGTIAGHTGQISALQTGQSSGIIGYSTRAALYADLAHPDKSVAFVGNDPTAGYNGNYIKSGASGAGAWVQSTTDRVALIESAVHGIYTVGRVTKGFIYAKQTPGYTDGTHWSLVVEPGTKVDVSIPQNNGYSLTHSVNAGTFEVLTENSQPWYVLYMASGVLYMVGSNSVPVGREYFILGYVTAQPSGAGGGYLALRPVDGGHRLAGMLNGGICINASNIEYKRSLSLKADFGAVGDGVSDDSKAFERAQAYYGAIGYAPFNLTIEEGTYLTSYLEFYGIEVRGAGKTKTVIKNSGDKLGDFNINHLEDLALHDTKIRDYGTGTRFTFKNCKFVITAPDGADYTSYYHMYLGFYTPEGFSVEFDSCDWEYNSPIYSTVLIRRPGNVIFRNNTFKGNAYTSIRTTEPQPGGYYIYTGNKIRPLVTGGISGGQGIFFGSNRLTPIENILVEGNDIEGISEESISFDGYGNNPTLSSVICNGSITSVSNDSNGRLVLESSMIYNNGSAYVDCPVSVRTDWKTFYFTLGEGTGVDGTIAHIYSFDSGANTITLDSFIPASKVAVGGKVGVHGGFYNCTIRNNVIHSTYGASNAYATPISIYLDVFGFLIQGNKIYGSANGINVAGGCMDQYQTLAWHNTVCDNVIINTNQIEGPDNGAIRAYSYDFGVAGGQKQYGNVFRNNSVVGGNVLIQKQQDFTWDGNVITGGGVVKFWKCGNALPTASSASIGRKFVLIADGVDGYATDITYWICKLIGGMYSWVECNG